jgi:hypothetical protein
MSDLPTTVTVGIETGIEIGWRDAGAKFVRFLDVSPRTLGTYRKAALVKLAPEVEAAITAYLKVAGTPKEGRSIFRSATQPGRTPHDQEHKQDDQATVNVIRARRSTCWAVAALRKLSSSSGTRISRRRKYTTTP